MTRLIGEVKADDRAAAFYTLLGNCRQHGIDAYSYLLDVFTRLPALTNQRVKELTPAAWAASTPVEPHPCQAAPQSCLA